MSARPADHTEENSAWLAGLLDHLERCGPQGLEALRYIRQRQTRVTVHAQPTGARWTLRGGIQVHPQYAGLKPDDPYTLSLVIHEVRHLQQGPLTALSVYGELEAWQLQFAFMKSQTGRCNDDPRRNGLLEQLLALPLSMERGTLAQARTLMQEYAGKRYRIDLLPLFPLPNEILYWLIGKWRSPS